MLAGQTGAELAWRAILAVLEALVAPATLAATRDQQIGVRCGEVTENFAGIRIAHDRAHRNHDQHVFAAAAEAVAAAAWLAVLGPECTLDPEIDQRVDAVAGAQRDAATQAAVAAVGAAEGHEFLAPETHAAAAAVAGLDLYACFVDEFHDFYCSNKKPGAWPG